MHQYNVVHIFLAVKYFSGERANRVSLFAHNSAFKI